MKLITWLCASFALAFSLNDAAICQQPYTTHNNIATVDLCDLLRKPLLYSGKTITTTVRIVRGKHVTGIWDPACSNLGADLYIEESARSSPSIMELDRMLSEAGMGDHPVIATLIGIWLPNQTTGNKFLPQPRRVLKVSEASHAERSARIERR